MIYESFDGLTAPILATFAWCLGIGLSSYYLVFKTRLFSHLIASPLAPPFLALPAIMFAFLMGFMSSEAWQNFSHARTALINESSAISQILNIPMQPPEFEKSSNQYVQSYLERVLTDEWSAKHHNESSSLEAQNALDKLELNVWKMTGACNQSVNKSSICTDPIAISAIVKAIGDLRNARTQRLSLGYQESVDTKWFLGIFLGLIAALAVAAVHRSNAKTGATALVLFCLSMWVSFCMVTLYINPYKWADRLDPAPLGVILEALKSGHNR